MKYLYLARLRGCRVVVVNPYLEPGLDRYWVPSNAESALFGTKMCDLHVPVRPGGDVAFACAALKLLIERGAVDQAFVAAHTDGWDELVADLDARSLDELLDEAGLDPGPGRGVRRRVRGAPTRRSCSGRWASPSTAARSTACGPSSTSALARGNVGRDGAGLMPLRGHSGVQGGAEMGAYATAFPGGIEINERTAARAGRRLGLPGARPRRASPRPRWSRPPSGRRARRALELGRQLPRRAARPGRGRGRPRPGAAAGAPGHPAELADAGARRRRDPAAGGHPLRAGGRRHRDHHRAPHRLLPRDPPPGRRGPQRVAAVRRRGRPGAARSEGRLRLARQPGAARGDRRRRAALRRHRAAVRRPATACSGAAATCAPAAIFPTADGPGPVPAGRCRPATTCPRACSRSPPGGASSSTRWCWPRPIRSPAPGATPSTSTRDEAAALGLADGDAVVLRSELGPMAGHLKTVRLPAPQPPGALARGQRAAADRARAPRARLAGARLQRARVDRACSRPPAVSRRVPGRVTVPGGNRITYRAARLGRRATASRRVLPDFVIAGAARCGTTSLYRYLVEHPLVVAAQIKEVHFVDRQHNFDKGEHWYRSWFPTRSALRRRRSPAGRRPGHLRRVDAELLRPSRSRVATAGRGARRSHRRAAARADRPGVEPVPVAAVVGRRDARPGRRAARRGRPGRRRLRDDAGRPQHAQPLHLPRATWPAAATPTSSSGGSTRSPWSSCSCCAARTSSPTRCRPRPHLRLPRAASVRPVDLRRPERRHRRRLVGRSDRRRAAGWLDDHFAEPNRRLADLTASLSTGPITWP